MHIETSPRRSIQDSDYDIDPYGNLVYWDALNQNYKLLSPGQQICDPAICIGKVGQQNILPTHFSLKPKDLDDTVITNEWGRAMAKPIPPGISVFLFWGSPSTKQQDLASLSMSHLGRPVTKKNRLYVTQVEQIAQSGWTPFFAPLINRNFPVYNPLHVILCPKSVLSDGTRSDALYEEKEKLVEAFIRW